MWMCLFGPLPKPAWFGNLAQLGYIISVRLVGAILANVFVFGGNAFYDVYAKGEAYWKISPAADQNAAGAIMMVEESILTICLFAWLFIKSAREAEERQELLDLAAGARLRADRAARGARRRRGARGRAALADRGRRASSRGRARAGGARSGARPRRRGRAAPAPARRSGRAAPRRSRTASRREAVGREDRRARVEADVRVLGDEQVVVEALVLARVGDDVRSSGVRIA